MEADIPFKISGDFKYDFEKEVLDIVNEERAKVGIEPLKMDTKLFETAQQRAAELAVLFSHTRPNLTDCFSGFFPTGLKERQNTLQQEFMEMKHLRSYGVLDGITWA